MAERNWLREFLNVYWLRPENAIWRALNCKALEDVEFSEPSLDLSCGDGIFSFIAAGGEFERTFDIFEGTGSLEEFYDDADIYDAAPDSYQPEIRRRPDYTISVGTDWKPNLLAKADELDFYDELIEHDNNDPLPFDDDEFETVFSNSAYWVDEIDRHLREIERVLAPGGQAVLVLKTSDVHNFLDYVETNWEDQLGTDLIEMIDRGRRANKSHLHDEAGWTQQLENAGFDVVDKHYSVSWWHASMWDVGLRPVSPHLIRMASFLPPNERRQIKEDWIETWESLLDPFNEIGFDMGRDTSAPEIVYVLESSS